MDFEPQAFNAQPRRYTAGEWETQKLNIERLYITEDRPLKEVILLLNQDFGFIASEKQLKSRLPKWGFDIKNLKSETMVELARTKVKRSLENKKSSFRVYKKPVDDRKIDRYLRRNDISEVELLMMNSPENVPSPAFSVFTPHSVRSPTPGADFTAGLARSPTPGLDFQSLTIADSQSPVTPVALTVIAEEVVMLDGPKDTHEPSLPGTLPPSAAEVAQTPTDELPKLSISPNFQTRGKITDTDIIQTLYPSAALPTTVRVVAEHNARSHSFKPLRSLHSSSDQTFATKAALTPVANPRTMGPPTGLRPSQRERSGYEV